MTLDAPLTGLNAPSKISCLALEILVPFSDICVGAVLRKKCPKKKWPCPKTEKKIHTCIYQLWLRAICYSFKQWASRKEKSTWTVIYDSQLTYIRINYFFFKSWWIWSTAVYFCHLYGLSPFSPLDEFKRKWNK